MDKIKVMKDRCRSFLNQKTKELHLPWERCNDDLYVSNPNILKVDIKETYKSEIERVSDEKGLRYLLKFSDINKILDDQSYKPLRKLGKLVFN